MDATDNMMEKKLIVVVKHLYTTIPHNNYLLCQTLNYKCNNDHILALQHFDQTVDIVLPLKTTVSACVDQNPSQ